MLWVDMRKEYKNIQTNFELNEGEFFLSHWQVLKNYKLQSSFLCLLIIMSIDIKLLDIRED